MLGVLIVLGIQRSSTTPPQPLPQKPSLKELLPNNVKNNKERIWIDGKEVEVDMSPKAIREAAERVLGKDAANRLLKEKNKVTDAPEKK